MNRPRVLNLRNALKSMVGERASRIKKKLKERLPEMTEEEGEEELAEYVNEPQPEHTKLQKKEEEK